MINGWASACFQLGVRLRVLICESGGGKWRDVTWFECARPLRGLLRVFRNKSPRNIARPPRFAWAQMTRASRPDRNYLFRIFRPKHERHQFVWNVLQHNHGNISRNITVSKFNFNPPPEARSLLIPHFQFVSLAMNLNFFISVLSLFVYIFITPFASFNIAIFF